MAANGDTNHHRAIIGSKDNFWIYSSQTGFDLTRPDQPIPPKISPVIKIETTKSPITIDPAKSALIIIDMQNYFLSPALGKSKGAGHAAVEQLVEYAIPACRKAGIGLVWINWGLTEEDLAGIPPGLKRAFGFECVVDNGDGEDGAIDGESVFTEKEHGFGVDKHGTVKSSGAETTQKGGASERRYVNAHRGVGTRMGMVKDPQTGEDIDAGRVLMREMWNTALYPPLDRIYEEGSELSKRPDRWIHKNRMSATWGVDSLCEQFLQKENIRTLLFAGVNTDQCVGGTLQDCFSKGFDCVLLKDGCGTTSPGYAQQSMEYNTENSWGFVTSCRAVAEGVEGMESE